MREKMWMITFCLLAGCGDPKPYASCESAGECTSVRADGVAQCLLIADAKICAWNCQSDADCASDDRYRRLCAEPPGSATDLPSACLPSCEDADVAGRAAACPDGYTCRSNATGNELKKICFPGK